MCPIDLRLVGGGGVGRGQGGNWGAEEGGERKKRKGGREEEGVKV